jgi:poly-gamma-glutamate capsule biosynthesis protein CapA/YwtB (metallophosphatase superfamily)
VIVSHEEYKGVPIYYSLGNFIFDQYWNSEVRCGMMLTATFRPFTPVQVSEQTVQLMKAGETVPGDCKFESSTNF